MFKPAWKSLVERLENRDDFESPYLDRLKARLGVAEISRSIEREILEEMAYALCRSSDKLNVALLEVDLARHEATHAASVELRRAKVAQYHQRRREAMRARWEFIVHREALGLYRHDIVDEEFPVPPVFREEDLPPIVAAAADETDADAVEERPSLLFWKRTGTR